MCVKKYLFLICFFYVFSSFAGVVIDKTNLVFYEDEKELSFSIRNISSTPVIIQTWVSVDAKKTLDFAVTPPMFRLEGNASSSLRVTKMKNDFLDDREQLYYVNVKSIPPSDPGLKNILAFAVNSKITLRYRPYGLTETGSLNAYKKLEFSVRNGMLHVVNETAYYVSLSNLSVDGYTVKGKSLMFPPFSTVDFKVNLVASKYYTVVWNSTQLDSVEQRKTFNR